MSATAKQCRDRLRQLRDEFAQLAQQRAAERRRRYWLTILERCPDSLR